MLKIFKYLWYGKEKIQSRKVVFTDTSTVQIKYNTNWGREAIGTAKTISGLMHYGVDCPDGSKIWGDVVYHIHGESLVKCIMDAETYIIEQIKILAKVQLKLFRVNVFYRGAFSQDAQDLLKESLKLNEDIKLMAAQIDEYKKLIEA